MNTQKLIQDCERRGILLEARGQNLVVAPEERTTPHIVELLRRHKFEVIATLEARQQAASLHIAKQALSHEFDGADGTMLAHIASGLRRSPHPLCQCALAQLELNATDNK